MRKVFIASILLLSTGLHGQSTVTFNPTHPNQSNAQCDFEQIDNPIMYICIDWVQDNVIAGWAYDKRSGHRPIGFEILGSTNLLPFQVIDVPRPDVANYFGTSDENLGFGLVTDQPLNGWNAVAVSDMPYSWDCGYDVNNGFWCGWISSQVIFTVQ